MQINNIAKQEHIKITPMLFFNICIFILKRNNDENVVIDIVRVKEETEEKVTCWRNMGESLSFEKSIFRK